MDTLFVTKLMQWNPVFIGFSIFSFILGIIFYTLKQQILQFISNWWKDWRFFKTRRVDFDGKIETSQTCVLRDPASGKLMIAVVVKYHKFAHLRELKRLIDVDIPFDEKENMYTRITMPIRQFREDWIVGSLPTKRYTNRFYNVRG